MTGSVVTIGEILVEIIAETRGYGFREPILLRGPYPSGAPAIFIDQVARLGQHAGMISCVGNDDFGRLNIERLSRDGVDTSAVRVASQQVTGSAFVRYRADGNRDFVYNIKHSASGVTRIDAAAEALLARCTHLHVMGTSLFSRVLVDETKKAIERVKARGGTISFDPNVRKEMLHIPNMRAALQTMLRLSDIFMPSGSELTLLTRAKSESDAILEILELGQTAVVVKRGSQGASYHDRSGSVTMPGFPATEIDPTGAGDCFGATFVTCWLQGHRIEECLRYANASGARAVEIRGPMEGTSSFAELDAFIANRRGDDR